MNNDTNKYTDTSHLTKDEIKKQHSFYTPNEIGNIMAKKLDWKPGETILDPCVGKGSLLQACKDVYPELTNDLLYGVDIDAEAIKFCIENFPGGHFQVGDCLKNDIMSDKFWEKDPLKNNETSELF